MLKKALIGGLNKIYALGPVFRNEDLDATHTSEYTLLEVYERDSTCEGMIKLVETLVQQSAKSVLVEKIGDQDLSSPWVRIEFQDVCRELNLDPDMSPKTQLDLVEKHLKEHYKNTGVHLLRIPSIIMPLAKDHNGLAEYCDSYLLGIQVGTMYSEENDPVNLRNKWALNLQNEVDEKSLVNEDFLEDLTIGAPKCGGMGMGIDRLVRLILGLESIRDAQAFPLI